MFKPRRWARAVIGIGILQASLSAMSTAWVAEGSWTGPSDPDDPGCLQVALFALVSIVVPFIAYAADSRRVLIRYPSRPSSAWQVAGGLIGLSLSLAGLHAFVLAATIQGGADVLLIYRLIVPAFVVGSMGAAAGIVVALLVLWVVDD